MRSIIRQNQASTRHRLRPIAFETGYLGGTHNGVDDIVKTAREPPIPTIFLGINKPNIGLSALPAIRDHFVAIEKAESIPVYIANPLNCCSALIRRKGGQHGRDQLGFGNGLQYSFRQ
jgi:hypothetical protein